MTRAPLLCLALLAACPGSGDETGTSTGTTSSTSTTSTGTTAMPTTGEPAELQRCTPHCNIDADCRIAGNDIGFVCREGVCDTPTCSDDATCRARLGGWTVACADADGCSPLTACIVVDAKTNAGACAYVPGPDLACADLGLDELTETAIAGGDVLVCGDANATCVDARCVSPCLADSDCSIQQGTPYCDVGTGVCQCTGDLDCQQTGAPGLVACLAGRCGCEVDDDCAGGDNVDICRAGACGCSGPRACSTPVFDRATLVCEPA